jgi:hypothetical protein
MVGLFAYGIILFPDAPIHPCAETHFCGKQGQPRTPDDFRRYQRWETGMLWIWPLGIGALILVKRRIPRRDWELMSPEARYRVLHGPKVDHAAIRKTYETSERADKDT